jgi:hypothetical protein
MAVEKKYLFRFTVEGSGEFPVDMLRYDSAWPSSESDSYRISAHYGMPDAKACERRKVELKAYGWHKRWEPNQARWRSFGWNVTELQFVP